MGAGNVALAGHRDTFFRGLSRVRLDDVIELETLRGNFKYRVERITVVGPQDIQVVQSPEWDLTLVTGFPFHSRAGPRRGISCRARAWAADRMDIRLLISVLFRRELERFAGRGEVLL